MKEKAYYIKIHSISRFIVAFIAIILSCISLINITLPQTENKILTIIQFLLIFLTSLYLAHLIGMGKAKILFTEEGLVHIWERRFILSWEKNFKIPWNIVDNYVFQEDRTFDSFIINLTNKKRYKINRINILPIKDDFEKLVTDFPKFSNDYKKLLTTDILIESIKEGESIYSSKSFRLVFYFMAVVFLVLLFIKVLNPESETKWSALGVIGSGILYYGLMIKSRKRNN